VEFSRLEGKRALQGFYQGQVLSNIVVLLAYPFCDGDPLANGPLYYYPDARGSWIAQRSAIYVCHQLHLHSAFYNMR
jgi:hypothetical protein